LFHPFPCLLISRKQENGSTIFKKFYGRDSGVQQVGERVKHLSPHERRKAAMKSSSAGGKLSISYNPQ
jgi:hypothetical protein